MKLLIALLVVLGITAATEYIVYMQASNDVQEVHEQIQVTSSEIDGLELDALRESCPAEDQAVYADIVRRGGDIQAAVKTLESSEWLSEFTSDAEMEDLRQGSLNLTLALQHKKLDCLKRQYKLIGSK